MHAAGDFNPVLRTGNKQCGGCSIRSGGIVVHDGDGDGPGGRIAAARVDNVVITFAVNLKKTLIIPGGKYAGIAVTFNAGKYAALAWLANTDAPRPVTMLPDGAQIATGIDDGVLDSEFAQPFDGAV